MDGQVSAGGRGWPMQIGRHGVPLMCAVRLGFWGGGIGLSARGLPFPRCRGAHPRRGAAPEAQGAATGALALVPAGKLRVLRVTLGASRWLICLWTT